MIRGATWEASTGVAGHMSWLMEQYKSDGIPTRYACLTYSQRRVPPSLLSFLDDEYMSAYTNFILTICKKYLLSDTPLSSQYCPNNFQQLSPNTASFFVTFIHGIFIILYNRSFELKLHSDSRHYQCSISDFIKYFFHYCTYFRACTFFPKLYK